MLARDQEQISEPGGLQRPRFGSDFVRRQRHAQDWVLARKPAIAAAVDALVRKVKRGKQPDDPAETLPGDFLRLAVNFLQEAERGGRDQRREITQGAGGSGQGAFDVERAGVPRDLEPGGQRQSRKFAHETHGPSLVWCLRNCYAFVALKSR